MLNFSKRKSSVIAWAGIGVAFVVAGGQAPAFAANNAKPSTVLAVSAGPTASPAVMIARILDKWQPVSSELQQDATLWRGQLAALLRNVSPDMLGTIDRMEARSDIKGSLVAAYRGVTTMASLDLAGQVTKGAAGTKLGSPTTDLVFVPVPPCRIVDTRNAGGPIAAGTSRQFYFYAQSAGYSFSSQGGIAGTAASACPLTALTSQGGALGSVAPAAVMATVVDVSPSAAGNFIVWGGGSGTIPNSSALNFVAGQTLANTTVVPGGGRIGGALDFQVNYNGAIGQSDVVVDVVGYFVENAQTALDCATLTNNGSVSVIGDFNVAYTGCPTGYTQTGGYCFGPVGNNSLYLLETGSGSCAFRNLANASAVGHSVSVCCRVPGR